MKGSLIVINGVLKFSKNLGDYIHEHNNAEFDAELILYEKAEHYLHKYYRGYLLPDMANHIGDDVDDIHSLMKDLFAIEEVESWLDIPKRHRKACQRYEKINNNKITRWYIKSTSGMTHREFKEYIIKVEHHFFSVLAGRLDPKTQEEAYRLRVKGMEENIKSKDRVILSMN